MPLQDTHPTPAFGGFGFKPHSRWNTIEIAEVARGMLRPDCVRIKGLPTLRLRKGAPLPDSGEIRALTITKRGRRIFVNLTYEVDRQILAPSDNRVGIGMGMSSDVALSTGERVALQRSPDANLERAQQRLSRCREGSIRWRERRKVLSNHQYRERIRRRNEFHRVSTEIVRRFGLIAVNDLVNSTSPRPSPGKTESSGRNAAGMGRQSPEQAWGLLQIQLAYKAEWAGRKFVRVDSRHTGQMCSTCRTVAASAQDGNQYNCPHCGNRMDADINASVNVLRLGMAGGTSPPPAPESSELYAS